VAELSDNVFLLEECPHDWLFPQCSAVVSLNLSLRVGLYGKALEFVSVVYSMLV